MTIVPDHSLTDFITRFAPFTVLTGAGCSTASGIPGYRDEDGNWKHKSPMTIAEFKGGEAARQRYWARSFSAWARFSDARPNEAHAALATMQRAGLVDLLITQNVDGLHQQAGSPSVMELHGGLANVRCMSCRATEPRPVLQRRLTQLNSDWSTAISSIGPDGDADLAESGVDQFSVCDCETCGGVLKPDVVFFGESVPAERVRAAADSVERSNGLLVVGSSLMVFSGFRLARQAAAAGKPIAIINRGKTRADDLATLKLEADCGEALSQVLKHIDGTKDI